MESSDKNRFDNGSMITEEYLEFIEREVFLSFDEAHRDYLNGNENAETVMMYEEALKFIQKLKDSREKEEEKRINRAKSAKETLKAIS